LPVKPGAMQVLSPIQPTAKILSVFKFGKPQGAAGGIFRIKTPPIANFDQWHFVAAVYDQRTVTLSVDGKEAIRGVLKSDMRAYDDFFTIGGSGFRERLVRRVYTRAV